MVEGDTITGMAVHAPPDPPLQTGIYGYDVEKNDAGARKMSRIGGPIPGIVGESDADSAISVGKQMELESTNSIKYRTCSWPKVSTKSTAASHILEAKDFVMVTPDQVMRFAE